MSEFERKIIEIPEISRVEGHAAVIVDLSGGKVSSVKLDVFEGTRFFERIVLGHHFSEIPHITSRVCAICSTGHVLAAIFAIERIHEFEPPPSITLLRELMHLGMIIESHATHVCALALPDFLGTKDLLTFATEHTNEFQIWNKLRNLGSAMQTCIGGRPFHPVNLHPGGFSRIPNRENLLALLKSLETETEVAVELGEKLLNAAIPFEKTCTTPFLALQADNSHYSFFGDSVISSEGWSASIQDYRSYLMEHTVPYSHAKHSGPGGKPVMVGSLARLHFFSDRLQAESAKLYRKSPLINRNQNTVLNNLGQCVELIEAITRSKNIIAQLLAEELPTATDVNIIRPRSGSAVGAVECPRGTLYHSYEIDASGKIVAADMVTPSAQNAARIEHDIKTVVEEYYSRANDQELQSYLETLVRAYDPCNTCATHMVKVNFRKTGVDS